MVIYEHVKGILSVPCYLDNGDYAEYTTDIAFTDSDIIRNSCSIKSSACDSSTFSLGSVRPAELSIQLHLEQDGINAYNLYGANHSVQLLSKRAVRLDFSWNVLGDIGIP